MRWLALALLGAAASAEAQGDFRPQGEHWMEFDAVSPPRSCPLKSEVEQWTRVLHRLGTGWSRTPGATGPRLHAQLQGLLSSCKGRLRGELIYWPWPVEDLAFKPIPGKPGQTRPTPTGETSALTIAINRLEGLEPIRQLNDEDGRSPVLLGVRKQETRRIAGFPVLGEAVLLITAPGREPFAPVSMEEALKAWVKYARGDPPAKARMQALLSSLSPEALRREAHLLRDSGREELVAQPGPKTAPLVRYNPAYFDDALPRHVPQVLAVDVHLIDLVAPLDDPRLRRVLARRMLEATDWQAMARELMH